MVEGTYACCTRKGGNEMTTQVETKQQARARNVLFAEVTDSRGERLLVEVYDGMLPDDMLVLLCQQSVMLRANYPQSDQRRSEMWEGPSEEIQKAIVEGLSWQSLS